MRLTYLALLAVATFSINPAFAADKDMSCADISAEMEELNAIEAAAGNAEMTNNVTQAGTSAAITGAVHAGAGSSIPLFGSIANIAGAVTSTNAEQAKKKAEDAGKRKIKLETIAEMKGC